MGDFFDKDTGRLLEVHDMPAEAQARLSSIKITREKTHTTTDGVDETWYDEGQRRSSHTTPVAWERRPRGKWYYTRTRRVAGRRVREYVGGGLVGLLAAAEDAERRAAREARANAWRAECARLASAEAQVQEVCDLTDQLARGQFLLAGYHQHHRGEWRQRRGRHK